ncbi:MAG: hypothetical protein ABFS02_13940, partial [Pseudomonadota bacterium]
TQTQAKFFRLPPLAHGCLTLGSTEEINFGETSEDKDKSLDNLPGPDELAEEIIENLEAGLNTFRDVVSIINSSGKAVRS